MLIGSPGARTEVRPISSTLTALSDIAIALALTSCGGGAMQSMAQHAAMSTPVKISPVALRSVNETTSFMGTLKSRKSAVLQPRVSGIISRIFVSAGDTVAEGAPLIELDPEKQKATFNSAAAAAQSTASDRRAAEDTLHSLEAQRGAKEATLKFMQKQLARYAWLSQQGAVARETYDNYATQLKVAQSELASICEQIAAQQAAIAKMDKMVEQYVANTRQERAQLQYYTVRAPFAGTVGDIPLRLGEYVDSSTKLTTVTENKPLEVYISVPAEKATALHKGMPVLLCDSSGSQLGEATVFFISPVADESQNVLIKALFPNSEGRLRSNQTVTAQVVWRRSDSITIPTFAVAHISGQDFVFVTEGAAPNMVAKQRAVVLGDIVGNDYIVKSGLHAGERLITSGVQNLIDNMPVSPKN